jgi:AraC-like DNA-binding protein/mannose-6-phosphate isomerase-like protein (cupin superfamily)
MRRGKRMRENQSLKNEVPKQHLVIDNDEEFRIELPFDSEASHIYYLGVNYYENWSTSIHYHDHFELCYVDEGHSQYKIDKTLYEVQKGQLLLTKPEEIHFGLAGKQMPFKLYYIGFRLERLHHLYPEFYRIGLQRIAMDQDSRVKAIFEHMITEIKNKAYLSLPMVEGLFQQLLVTTLRNFLDPTLLAEAPPRPLNNAIIEVMNQLHREVRYDYDPEQLARSIHISRSHLAREFKNSVGIPLGEYVRHLCLDKAKSELRNTSKAISQIADELHFSSIHTFSIFFKRFTGQTPTLYRQSTLMTK